MTEDEYLDELKYDPDEARWIWEETQRVLALHAELASYYRTKSRDHRTIKMLWEKITEGEAGLRAIGVHL